MNIPTINEATLSTDVPGVSINPSEFGQPAQALASLGEQGFKFATDLVERRKHAEALDFSFTRTMDDQTQFEQKRLELKTQDPTNYTAALKEWSDERFQANQEAAPTETAKRLYQRQSGEFFNRGIMTSTAEEFQARAVRYQVNMKQGIDDFSSELLSNPSPDYAMMKLQSIQGVLAKSAGVSLTPDEAHIMSEHVEESTAKNLVEGLLIQGMSRPPNERVNGVSTAQVSFQKGLDILNGRDPVAGELGIKIQPQDKAVLMLKLERAMKAKSHFDISELDRRGEEMIKALEVGAPNSSSYWPDLMTAYQQGHKTVDDVARMNGRARLADTYRQQMQAINDTPPSQVRAVLDQIKSAADVRDTAWVKAHPELGGAKDPNFLISDRLQYEQRAAQAIEDARVNREKDPVGEILKNPDNPAFRNMYSAIGNDPSKMKDFNIAITTEEKRLEVQNVRLIGQKESSDMARLLSNASEMTVKDVLTSKERLYGDQFDRVLKTVAGDHPENPVIAQLAVSTHIQNDLQREKTIGMLINRPDIDKEWNKNHTEKAASTDLQNAVNTEMKDYYAGLSQVSANGGSAKFRDAIAEVVMTQAKAQMNADPSMIAEQAAKNAKRIWSQDWNAFHGSDSDSYVVHPSSYVGTDIGGNPVRKPINPRYIDAYMSAHRNAIVLQEQKVQVPGSIRTDQKIVKERWFDTLEKNAHWIPTEHFDGMRLEYVNPNTGEREIVRDQKNNEMRVRFQDIMEHPDGRTLNQLRSGIVQGYDRLKSAVGQVPGVVDKVGNKVLHDMGKNLAPAWERKN